MPKKAKAKAKSKSKAKEVTVTNGLRKKTRDIRAERRRKNAKKRTA